MEIRDIINDIIGFIESLVAEVKKILDSIKINQFEIPTEEAAE